MDCEENVLVCLRIIIELIKQFRPANNPDVGRWGDVGEGRWGDVGEDGGMGGCGWGERKNGLKLG